MTLAHLVKAIGDGTGAPDSLVKAIGEKECDKATLTRALALLEGPDMLRAIDRDALRHRVETKLHAEGWVGLRYAEIPKARQILARLLD